MLFFFHALQVRPMIRHWGQWDRNKGGPGVATGRGQFGDGVGLRLGRGSSHGRSGYPRLLAEPSIPPAGRGRTHPSVFYTKDFPKGCPTANGAACGTIAAEQGGFMRYLTGHLLLETTHYRALVALISLKIPASQTSRKEPLFSTVLEGNWWAAKATAVWSLFTFFAGSWTLFIVTFEMCHLSGLHLISTCWGYKLSVW